MIVEGYTVKRITALITDKGKIYIHEHTNAAPASGPLTNSNEALVAIRDAIPLREIITRGFAGGGKDLEDAIAGAVRTLMADSYEEVD